MNRAALDYILGRLREPSTYAGLAALGGLLGLKFSPEQFSAIIQVLTAVAAAIAVFLPDVAKK